MKIVIFISDINHPINPYLAEWKKNKLNHDIEIIYELSNIPTSGNILFLVSCSEIVNLDVRSRFDFTLVIHASDLPVGRGWSPHIWSILNGSNEIVLSLLNAEDVVDSGDIWTKKIIELNKLDLYHEINRKIFCGEIELIDWACENIYKTTPVAQVGIPSYYEKRTRVDSELDVDKSIKEQFNLLRVCDPIRYPSYFYMGGKKFKITIEEYEDKDESSLL